MDHDFEKLFGIRRAARSVSCQSLLLICSALVSGLSAQQATLIGTVLADSSKRGLANAEIAIPTLGISTRSDSAGNFSLTRIAAGMNQILVRAVGYETLREAVIVSATDRIERDFFLRPAAVSIAAVDVKADATTSDRRLLGFEERRKIGLGKFLGQDYLEKAGGRKLADVLQSKFPGLRQIVMGGPAAIASTHGPTTYMRSGDAWDKRRGATLQCYVQVVVDGVFRYRGQPGEPLFDVNSIAPDQLAGVEFHLLGSTPSQYSSPGAACGTLIIWTRVRY